jgi:hypothetical protein
LRKFQVQKFYLKLRIFELKLRVFEPKLRIFKPKLRVFDPKLRVFAPKLRFFENRSFVFLNQSCSVCKDFFCPTETSVVVFGIFCDRNFGISNPYEVSNEVSVERKPEKFSKFQAKMNYCVLGWSEIYIYIV